MGEGVEKEKGGKGEREGEERKETPPAVVHVMLDGDCTCSVGWSHGHPRKKMLTIHIKIMA